MSRHAYSPSLGRHVAVENTEVPSAPTTRRRRGHAFTMFPDIWCQQLRKVKARGTTYHVAIVILDKSRWSEWVVMSNGVAGVSRHTKHDALRQLRDAGLILVEERRGKSPRVKALFRR
jgi:hypothetical protein